MKIDERNFAFAFRTTDAHDRIERGERDRHVARIRRDALLALSQNRVNAVESFERAASASRFAFVARGKCRIVKIITARALHEISADCRHVAQLRTGPGEERLAQDRITQRDQRMLRDIGVARERADANSPSFGNSSTCAS